MTPGSPELPQVASSTAQARARPAAVRGSPAARSKQPRPRRPTFMSLMMVWKRPPSALHSFSITASIFPARRGQDTLSGRLHCARGRARSARELFHPGSDLPPARRRFCREHAVLAINCTLSPKSQSETPSRSGGRVAYVQCSAPGLKNARGRLTIKPPRVPMTETAKPILVQRKPPADPGPAPFKKKKKKIFFQIYFFPKLQNKERENEIGQQQTRSARVARICCSQTRPPPPFYSCAPGPALALAELPGLLRGAHARSRP